MQINWLIDWENWIDFVEIKFYFKIKSKLTDFVKIRFYFTIKSKWIDFVKIRVYFKIKSEHHALPLIFFFKEKN
jgi:hypothetical protein